MGSGHLGLDCVALARPGVCPAPGQQLGFELGTRGFEDRGHPAITQLEPHSTALQCRAARGHRGRSASSALPAPGRAILPSRTRAQSRPGRGVDRKALGGQTAGGSWPQDTPLLPSAPPGTAARMRRRARLGFESRRTSCPLRRVPARPLAPSLRGRDREKRSDGRTPARTEDSRELDGHWPRSPFGSRKARVFIKASISTIGEITPDSAAILRNSERSGRYGRVNPDDPTSDRENRPDGARHKRTSMLLGLCGDS